MPPQQLQWKGPSAPRAERIPPELWTAHKDELCELYQRMKLDDLIPLMRVRHGFTPSRRQYISQFEKWHVHKYKATNDASSRIESPPVPTKPSSIRDIAMPDRDYLQALAQNYSTKRQQSRQSLQSSNGSQTSRGEKPKVPPKKRQKLDDFMSSKDPYANLDKAFESQETSRNALAQAWGFDTLSCRTFGSSAADSNCSTPTPSLIMDDEKDWISVDETSDVRRISNSADSCSYSDWDDFGPWMEPESTEMVPRRERKVDSTRPIDTFAASEIHDMKLAADSLTSLTFDREAFMLHVLTLKHLRTLANQPIGRIRPALIACARSAVSRSQVEVARSLLEQALALSRDKPVDAESFVLRMLLADTYSRRCDYSAAKPHVDLAWDSALANGNLFASLPDDDRSLDLLLYHHLSRGVHCHRSLTIETTFDPEVAFSTSSLESRLKDELIHRVPGPFELDSGVFGNPCIRSCLAWCASELERTSRIPGSWRTLSKKHYLKWALWVGLHCHLWQRWQNIKASCTTPQDLLWAEKTEILMGVGGANLLAYMSWLIIEKCTLEKRNSDREIIRQLRYGASKLSQLPDEDIAYDFLDFFSYFNHIGPRSDEEAVENASFSFLELFSWRGLLDNNSYAFRAFRNDARPYVKDFIERNLFIDLPDSQDPAPDNEKPSNKSSASLQIIFAATIPTMASSLHSSDFSALRAFKDRIQQSMRGGTQDGGMGLPSGVFRRSNATLPSMNDLSMAMASTLSLTSTSALDVLATVSSNVRDRFSDNPFGDSTYRLV